MARERRELPLTQAERDERMRRNPLVRGILHALSRIIQLLNFWP